MISIDSLNNPDKPGPVKGSEKPLSKPNNKDKKKAEEEVLDSWEDESVSSSASDDDGDGGVTSEKSSPAGTMTTIISPSKASTTTPSESRSSPHRGTRAPSPTLHARILNPLAGSGSHTTPSHDSATSSHGVGATRTGSGSGSADRRPEKHTGVANRMISHALGIRPAKRTEEQRVYDRAVRENERRRIAREREEEAARKAAEEEAKKSVWEG